MKKLLVIQVCAIVLISGSLAGIMTTTSVYDEVQSVIVSILCLSCIKLDPKTHLEFTFETANGQNHQEFILDNLSKGPVFLAYRTNPCEACDDMEPIIQDIFGVHFEKEEIVIKTVSFDDTNVTFIHINLDETTEDTQELFDSFSIYDQDHFEAVPMFTIITLGYERGFINPFYASVYGKLNLHNDEDRKQFLLNMISDGISLYNENYEGYNID